MMHTTVAHHPLTNAQPILKQLLANFSQFIYRDDVLWYETSFLPVQVTCAGHAPSQLPVQLLEHEPTEKSLT